MSEVDELDEVVQEFLVESYENLDQVERDLVTLEECPDDPELLGRIFRTVHTVKGTCGFLGYSKLERIAHVGENLLTKLRDGSLALDGDRTSALLSMSDAIRTILGCIEEHGGEGDGDYGPLVAVLERLLADSAPADSAPADSAPADSAPADSAPADSAPADSGPADTGPANSAPADTPPADTPHADTAPVSGELAVLEPEVVLPLGELLVQQGVATKQEIDSALTAQEDGDPRRLGDILVRRGAVRPAEVDSAIQRQSIARSGSKSISDSSVRVAVDLLDKLMNLVGELVLARNQVLQYTLSIEDAGFLATSQRLNLVTTELQEGVMKTRMQPIGNVWSKLPRVVRDLAKSCGKQIKLVQEGKETELDKTLVEAIKDPLTHLVRNSVDHGIEAPDVRELAGKSAEGHLVLSAFHESGQVNIQISDDGGGIDPDKIKAKAVEKRLVSKEQAERMSEREALHLVFLPGFSTAAAVTNVSGRGVGMDVVKTNIERIGGTVDVQSERGVGTTFKIKIPLTLAIIPALIVRSAGDRFAIPQVSLLELVRLEGTQAREAIESINGTPVYRLRGSLLPVADLRTELEQSEPAEDDEVINIVVLQADDQNFGLIVDAVQDTEEIVVKPLAKALKGVGVYSGATIMGDGHVALILDVLGLAQRAHVITAGAAELRAAHAGEAERLDAEARQTLLLFDVVAQRSMALPLSMITRLEEFPRTHLEEAGTNLVVQYRGQIMPLVFLSRAISGLGPSGGAESETLQVIVYTVGGHNVGLVVDRILDVVEDAIEVQVVGKRHGILGSAIIQDRVIELVDLDAIVRAEVGQIFAEAPATATVGA